MAGHKSTPALMASSLLLGLLFAIGHHFYYLHLDGRIVQSQSQQQWFLRAGTGLAFLVRAFLSAAVGIAYTQILWRTLSSKPITIGGLNSLFGVVHNAWDFATWEIWTAAPALAVVAIIAWALPLVAVVTPATLTVQVSSRPNITILDAPNPILDYSNSELYGRNGGLDGNGVLLPSTHVERLLLSVASQGSIMALPAPAPNASYGVEFYGPTMSCDVSKNETFSRHVCWYIDYKSSSKIGDSRCPRPEPSSFKRITGLKNRDMTVPQAGNGFVYVGFVPSYATVSPPQTPITINDTVEDKALNSLLWTLESTLVSKVPRLDRTGRIDEPVNLFVAVPSKAPFHADKTIVCQLYNSSFALNFTFNNGQQHVSHKTERINRVGAFNTNKCKDMDPDYCSASHAYLSMMSAMGRFLVGTLFWNVMGGLDAKQTQIKSSVLMDTQEMQSFNENGTDSMIGNISMADALEDLFTNLTISLFSHPKFLQNSTAASNGPITYSSPQNEFSYDPRNLFIAYGIGLLLTAAIVVVGLLCIKSASESYESRFSTILRTTRNPDLDNIVPAAETTGAEPLSKHLSNVRLVLRRQGGGPETSDGEKVTFFAVDSKLDDMKMEQNNSPAESLLRQDGTKTEPDTTVEGLDVDKQSPWERNRGRNLEMSNYRQDAERDCDTTS